MTRRAHQILLFILIVLPPLGAFLFTSAFFTPSRHPTTRPPSAPEAHVHFFDVGQGDAILLRDAEGNDLLVDGGPSDAILAKLGETLPPTDRLIEAVVDRKSTRLNSSH